MRSTLFGNHLNEMLTHDRSGLEAHTGMHTPFRYAPGAGCTSLTHCCTAVSLPVHRWRLDRFYPIGVPWAESFDTRFADKLQKDYGTAKFSEAVAGKDSKCNDVTRSNGWDHYNIGPVRIYCLQSSTVFSKQPCTIVCVFICECHCACH